MQAWEEKSFPRFLSGAGFVLFLAFVFACHVFPLTDTDIWWHLSSARWIWQHHRLPRWDPFCLSSLGQPWIDAQWGFQLLVYALWKCGGAPALVLGKAGAAAALCGIVFRRGWTAKTAPLLAAFGTYAMFHGRYLADLRPLWLTLILLALQYRWLRQWMESGGRRLAVQLIAAQWALAQVQGLYWLGPIQAGLLLLGERWDRGNRLPAGLPVAGAWKLWMALAWVGFLNPYGWQGFLFPFRLLLRIVPSSANVFSTEVAENIPYARWLWENPLMAYPFLVIAAVTLGLLVFSRCRGVMGEALLWLTYGALGLMAQRNLPLFLLASALVVVRVLETDGAKTRSPWNSAWLPGIAMFCLALTGLNMLRFGSELYQARQWENRGSWETPFRFPSGTVAYLQAHDFRGGIFNEMRYGGYLGWHLQTRFHPFIDGRMILHDAEFMREFLGVFDHPEDFPSYQKRYGINLVSLPIGEDNRYLPLAAYLVRSGIMIPLYCDGAEILLGSEDAWRGGKTPKAWTHSMGENEAAIRFGGNAALWDRARDRLQVWEQAIEP